MGAALSLDFLSAVPFFLGTTSKLDCYWVGSLDFSFLENKGDFH